MLLLGTALWTPNGKGFHIGVFACVVTNHEIISSVNCQNQQCRKTRCRNIRGRGRVCYRAYALRKCRVYGRSRVCGRVVAWKMIRKVVIKGIRWCRRFNGRKVCGARRFDFLLNRKTIFKCPVSHYLKETPMHPSWKKKDLLQGYSY